MRRVLLVLVLAAAGAPVGAQDSPPDRLGAACRELETGDPKRIYAAVQAISQLGGASLPALEERLKESKGRMRDYLELAVEEIRNAPFLPGFPPVKRVTMKSTDRNVVDLILDLKARTGVPLSIDNLADEEKLPEIPFEVKDATVLEALDAICHAGNLNVSMDNGQVSLTAGVYSEQPRFFYGHYCFRLGDFEITKVVNFRKPALQRFNIAIVLIWDPAAAPTRFKPIRVLEAADDHGRNLLIPPPAPGAGDEDEDAQDGSIHLLPPSPAATKLTMLRGYMPVLLPKTRARIVVDSPVEAKTVTSGDLRCRILGFDKDQRSMSVQLSSKKFKPEALQQLDYTVQVGLKGWESNRSYVTVMSHSDHAVDLVVHFEPLRALDGVSRPQDEGAPALTVERLELSIVTSTQEKRIPFEFRDLKIK